MLLSWHTIHANSRSEDPFVSNTTHHDHFASNTTHHVDCIPDIHGNDHFASNTTSHDQRDDFDTCESDQSASKSHLNGDDEHAYNKLCTPTHSQTVLDTTNQDHPTAD